MLLKKVEEGYLIVVHIVGPVLMTFILPKGSVLISACVVRITPKKGFYLRVNAL